LGDSFKVEHQPAFALVVIQLEAERSIGAEVGTTVSMSANVSTFTARGGSGFSFGGDN
jgi:uncharacterized protein (AIM24 family)